MNGSAIDARGPSDTGTPAPVLKHVTVPFDDIRSLDLMLTVWTGLAGYTSVVAVNPRRPSMTIPFRMSALGWASR